MVDKKKGEPQQTSRAASSAEGRAESGAGPQTQPVVDLLTSILTDVQTQVRRKTPDPLKGEAVRAVEQFREIGAALALQPRPTITLTADPKVFGPNGGTTKLSWLSTDARTVSIDRTVGGLPQPTIGEVTPAAGGSIEVSVLTSTIFTATAKGPCASATATVDVTVGSIL